MVRKQETKGGAYRYCSRQHGRACVRVCLCVCGVVVAVVVGGYNSIRAPLTSCELHFQQRSASVLGQSPGRHAHIHKQVYTHNELATVIFDGVLYS